MTEHTSSVIEAQVDYLTCSAHSEERSLRLDALADYLIEGQEALGNKRAGWRSMGYVGYHAGDIDWGRRDDRQSILRVSGGRAAELLSRAISVADNFSRLDVAVTWRAVPPDPWLGRNAYSNAEAWYHQHTNAARPMATGDADGGFTCYLGDPRSPYYGRIYNKEAERASQRDKAMRDRYQGCWRYEVEAHDSRALALATAIGDQEDRDSWIQQWSHDFWTKRGIPPMFPPTGAAAILPGFHRRTDDESSLRHLAKNVRPTLKRLKAHGRENDLRDALEMSPFKSLADQLAYLRSVYPGMLPNVRPDERPTKGDTDNA
jgi:hypothetical protein